MVQGSVTPGPAGLLPQDGLRPAEDRASATPPGTGRTGSSPTTASTSGRRTRSSARTPPRRRSSRCRCPSSTPTGSRPGLRQRDRLLRGRQLARRVPARAAVTKSFGIASLHLVARRVVRRALRRHPALGSAAARSTTPKPARLLRGLARPAEQRPSGPRATHLERRPDGGIGQLAPSIAADVGVRGSSASSRNCVSASRMAAAAGVVVRRRSRGGRRRARRAWPWRTPAPSGTPGSSTGTGRTRRPTRRRTAPRPVSWRRRRPPRPRASRPTCRRRHARGRRRRPGRAPSARRRCRRRSGRSPRSASGRSAPLGRPATTMMTNGDVEGLVARSRYRRPRVEVRRVGEDGGGHDEPGRGPFLEQRGVDAGVAVPAVGEHDERSRARRADRHEEIGDQDPALGRRDRAARRAVMRLGSKKRTDALCTA